MGALGAVRMAASAGDLSGKLVAEAKAMSKSFGDRSIVDKLDLLVMRGDRLGIVGPNGAGKTTLIKLLTGALAPDAGTIRLGTNLQTVTLDQSRQSLDPASDAGRCHHRRPRLDRHHQWRDDAMWSAT